MQLIIGSIPIILYVAALALALVGMRSPRMSPELSPLAGWMLALSLALNSLWAAFAHAFFAAQVAHSIGWPPSPFQHEIAGANLGIGLGAIAASMLGRRAAWTMFVVSASFLWSDAGVHVYSMLESSNFAISNAGPIFWWDILTPLTLLIALLRKPA